MQKPKRLILHKRVRKNISGSEKKPRVCVFKSGQHIYAQVIDDSSHKTLASESDLKIKNGTKSERASVVGENLAKKIISLKLKELVFDRGGFKYHGRVLALAEGLRKGGVKI
ncbi:MAG: hypothetical protein ACD_30C00002G0020 [uncultured bacterium]|uniref:Large ribosomal subunit protein uL18 n=4 Tax=Candidatus Daviesiibacteriota TaxID=1752718 RepID=A0A0G0HE75_9BACT|nr:MAG: hypothetical protein ACD_30C00002G0020 [uncultured bacterium]KKQ10414.1 MAG: 50S ribosomal protein L18 [Candidatus Daviesbacteria bacterium GW2011_GWB1_36_5]KKQ15794.1 MAG: 50S ribosomal protein L18 [Candidatus Daviesbacteria bacterium GW2011_GWA1_36_8]OGE16574.1 MAG: 50S ribosomal protein L18 [Candidatus Daviesbacteria bacterium RIFCSPHIGHO2_01_FULL_36_37]OGE31745.1 MAG: 50S ribosomal protein L18 [Candidatus Daviesbacteria bacterium RIFCSPHIGHO2_02_FULL_37_9]OGE34657.1 MAG: 50S riboso